MTVAELLEGSRQAHQRYREAVPHRIKAGESTVVVNGDVELAGQFLVEACRLRAEAHVLDPQRLDPAWKDEPLTYEHDALLTFYSTQLSA